MPTGQSVDITPPSFKIPAWEPGGPWCGKPTRFHPMKCRTPFYPPPANGAGDLQLRIDNHQPLPKEPELSGGDPAPRAPVKAGDPVDLFTGRFALSSTDLVIPTAVIPIVMQRSYRSGPGYYGPFGRGWDHAYNVYLRPLYDGSIAFWTGQLQELRFRPSSTGG